MIYAALFAAQSDISCQIVLIYPLAQNKVTTTRHQRCARIYPHHAVWGAVRCADMNSAVQCGCGFAMNIAVRLRIPVLTENAVRCGGTSKNILLELFLNRVSDLFHQGLQPVSYLADTRYR